MAAVARVGGRDRRRHLLTMVAAGCALTARTDAQTIVTVAGGALGDGLPARAVATGRPVDVAFGPDGDPYVADASGCTVLRVRRATGRVALVAGSGTCAFAGDGGPAVAASLGTPGGIYVDTAGHLFVTDVDNDRLRRVDARTGRIETIAGDGVDRFAGDGGPARAASLSGPLGITGAGGVLYLADEGNLRVRRIRADGRIETVLGPLGPGETEVKPSDVALAGGRLYVADPEQDRILAVHLATGRVLTVAQADEEAGDPSLDHAALASAVREPTSIAADGRGRLYIVSPEHDCVFVLDVAAGRVRVAAGSRAAARNESGFGGDGGPAQDALFDDPVAIASDPAGNLLVAEEENRRVRRIDARSQTITTLVGNGTAAATGDGWPAVSARLDAPRALALDPAGALYVADAGNGRVRKVDPVDGAIVTVMGGEPDRRSRLARGREVLTVAANGLAVGPQGDLFASDGIVLARTADDARTVTVLRGGDRLQDPQGLAFDAARGVLYVVEDSQARPGVRAISWPAGEDRFIPTDHRFTAIAVGPTGDLFVTGSHQVRRIDPATGASTLVAGNGRLGATEGAGTFSGDGGSAVEAGLSRPAGVAVDGDGNVFIADTGNHRVRRVAAVTGTITTIAGSGAAGFGGDGGPATAALLDAPRGLAVAADGTLYVADAGNARVRAVLPDEPAAPHLRRRLGRVVPEDQGAPPEDVEVARTCQLLTRHLPTLVAEGEERLRARGTELVQRALAGLASPDPARQRLAAERLLVLVSPWARARRAARAHRGHMALLVPPRPVERAAAHAEALRIRAAALRAFENLLGSQEDEALWAVRELVAEVGDDSTTGALTTLLRRRPADPRSDVLMNVIAAIDGFRPSWSGAVSDCGNTTPDEVAALAAAEAVKRKPRIAAFLRWRAQLSTQTALERRRAALAQWEGGLSSAVHPEWPSDMRDEPHGDLSPVVRLGEPAVPLLRRLATETSDPELAAGAEVAIAAITGQTDADLLSELFAGDDAEAAYAVALVRAAAGRAWSGPLARLALRDDPLGRSAAEALAVTALRRALPALRSAPPGNWTAVYAAKELEEGLRAPEW